MKRTQDKLYPSKPDYWVLAIVGMLVLIGLAFVYSASLGHNPANPTYLLKRQALWVVLGTVALVAAARFNYRRIQLYTLPALGFGIVLLAVVLLVGDRVHGSIRWLGDIIGQEGSVQPSELMKLILVSYVAYWLSTKGAEIRHATYGLIPFSLIVGLVAALILLQPDFSTAVIITGVALSMFLVAGAVVWQLVAVGGLGLAFAALLVIGSDYRMGRIGAFRQAFIDPLEAGYHVRQTVLTLGSGGLVGRGLGNGILKFGWLPVGYTDSIYAVIGEELGFLGCVMVLALFAALAWRGYRIAAQAQDSFGAFLAAGLTTLLVVQALVNIGVATAAVPFTGVTLPFISYGGLSMVVSLVAVGVLFNISGHRIED